MAKKGKTVMPSRRLQAKSKMCTLQTGKLCYNAININNYVLVLICRIIVYFDPHHILCIFKFTLQNQAS